MAADTGQILKIQILAKYLLRSDDKCKYLCAVNRLKLLLVEQGRGGVGRGGVGVW